MAAFNSLLHRLTSIPLEHDDYIDELNTIKYIAEVNGYQSSMIERLLRKHKKKNVISTRNKNNKVKFISTKYTNNISMVVKNEFLKHNILVSFRPTNNVQKLLRPETQQFKEKSTGVYKMVCNDCDMVYIGQTGRARCV